MPRILSPRPLLTALTVALLGAAILATSASAAPRVVIFDLYATPLVKPDRIFFQANSGPYLRDLAWTGWGSATAVGTGHWILDCSTGGVSCAPGDPSLDYPATYTLSDLARCPRFGPGARSYRKGVVTEQRPDGPHTFSFSSDYDFCAPRPKAAKAAALVARYARRHLHARNPRVHCSTTGATSLECTARWRSGGKVRSRGFDVFPQMNGPITVRPFG